MRGISLGKPIPREPRASEIDQPGSEKRGIRSGTDKRNGGRRLHPGLKCGETKENRMLKDESTIRNNVCRFIVGPASVAR